MQRVLSSVVFVFASLGRQEEFVSKVSETVIANGAHGEFCNASPMQFRGTF